MSSGDSKVSGSLSAGSGLVMEGSSSLKCVDPKEEGIREGASRVSKSASRWWRGYGGGNPESGGQGVWGVDKGGAGGGGRTFWAKVSGREVTVGDCDGLETRADEGEVKGFEVENGLELCGGGVANGFALPLFRGAEVKLKRILPRF